MEKDTPFLQLLFCAWLALFWVIFLWNFFDRGVYALGINAFVFLSMFYGLFIWKLYKNKKYAPRDLLWMIPISFIIASFAIYDNPFLKAASIPVLPTLFTLFYNFAFLTERETHYWDYEFVVKIFSRSVFFLGEVRDTAKMYLTLIMPADKTNNRVGIRIVAGLLLFIAVALIVFIPLLSSADPIFSKKVSVITGWLQEVFVRSFAYRIFVFMILSVLFFSVLAAWGKQFDYQKKEGDGKQVDSIIVGIVLGGILCIYALFLWVQIGRLWVGELPFDFKETEQLVKSGFWQLLALSLINILIYFFAYRKTVSFVQKILTIFTTASLLLLVSAGHRMGLYVTYYGFSYEKFFASYAVVYCVILYVWLIGQQFRNERSNIAKFLMMLFLWMFAFISLFPVEQFIFRTNMVLYNREGSRILLREMKMLSPDVFALVKKYKEDELLKDADGYDWNQWIEKQEKIIAEKAWHEKNVMNIISFW